MKYGENWRLVAWCAALAALIVTGCATGNSADGKPHRTSEQDTHRKNIAVEEMRTAIRARDAAVKEKQDAESARIQALKERDAAVKVKDDAARQLQAILKATESAERDKEDAIKAKAVAIRQKQDAERELEDALRRKNAGGM